MLFIKTGKLPQQHIDLFMGHGTFAGRQYTARLALLLTFTRLQMPGVAPLKSGNLRRAQRLIEIVRLEAGKQHGHLLDTAHRRRAITLTRHLRF